jgi:hypothetical protein
MRPLFFCCLLLLVTFSGFGDSISLTPVADTTISEGNAAHVNELDGTLIVGGLLQLTSKCRGLIRFDLSNIPPTAVITSATVTVTVTISKAGATEHIHELHRLLAPWNETSATWDGSGGVTWNGGDFIEDADASVGFGGAETYMFESTTGLVATVQMWLTDSETNHGWILISQDEATPGTARRVATRPVANQPVLTIGYSMPPPPPADFDVTSPGSLFSINGEEPNPELTLTRGSNYTFAISTDPSHPFQIVRDLQGTPYEDGVVNNGISSGTITFTVPQSAPDTLFYICPIHFFSGTIRVVNSAEPPAPLVQILSMELSASNVVLKSTGTNGWLAVPEFSSNLLVSNWAVVPSFTNSFLNGTNVMIFDRLDPICGSNVFLRVRNTRN